MITTHKGENEIEVGTKGKEVANHQEKLTKIEGRPFIKSIQVLPPREAKVMMMLSDTAMASLVSPASHRPDIRGSGSDSIFVFS